MTRRASTIRMQPDWSARGTTERALGRRTEAIVQRFDMDPACIHLPPLLRQPEPRCTRRNFYGNFVPVQERVRLVRTLGRPRESSRCFLVEYGRARHSWDWTMYRGWYRPARSRADPSTAAAAVPWEFCTGRVERTVPAAMPGVPDSASRRSPQPALGGEQVEVRRPARSGTDGTTRPHVEFAAPVQSRALTPSSRRTTSRTTGARSGPGASRAFGPWGHERILFALRDGVDDQGRARLRDRLAGAAAPRPEPRSTIDDRYQRVDRGF